MREITESKGKEERVENRSLPHFPAYNSHDLLLYFVVLAPCPILLLYYIAL